MSILDALRKQKSSIDDFAMLPQAMIMQLAKTGQIGKEMVLPILNRKAELNQAAMNNKAMRQPAQQPTLLEKILSAEQPQQMTDMGVAQLPIREDMYNEQRMAGGGIVAFQNNPDQPISEDMPTTDETNPYLRRSQGIYEAGRQFFTPRNYNPFAKMGDLYQSYQQNIGQPFAAAANRFINETPEQQAERFRRASQARENIGKRMSGVPTTAEEARRLAPAEKIVGNEQALYDAERIAKESGRTAMPSVGPQGQVIAPDDGTKKQKVAAAGANVAAQETGTSAIDEYAKILKQQGEDSAKARQEAKYMRLLEAGLGIMGGTSQYALTNIGQGAIGAAKGFAEDVKGFRAEERERAKLLGSLGMEKEKLGITKKHYEDVARLGEQELAIKKIIASKAPGEVQLIERYAASKGIPFGQAAEEFLGLKKDPFMSQFKPGAKIDRSALKKDLAKYGIVLPE